MKALIDSSIIIDHLRNHNHVDETTFISILHNCEEIYFSLVTVAEIFSGLSAAQMEKQINDIFFSGHIINLDYNLMRVAGEVRRNTDISLIDAIIAACALELDLPVATLNLKDFQKVPRLRLYKIK